jgi:thymidylate synthase
MVDALAWEVQYPDLIHRTLKGAVCEATRGSFNEVLGASLRIADARDRLIQSPARGWNVYSAVGQWLWLHQPTDFEGMTKYYEDGYQLHAGQDVTIRILGTYGPRLFGQAGADAQIAYIVKRLQEQPTTRKAVGTVYRPGDDHDPMKGDEVPCTMGLQFLQREEQLHMYVMMRSQDAWSMLPNDVFMFTMLQEYVARRIGCEPGAFRQMVSSSHIYDRHQDAAWKYVNSRPGRAARMPPMPADELEPGLAQLGRIERSVRLEARAAMDANAANNSNPSPNIQVIEAAVMDVDLPEYWAQLALVLGCYGAANAGAGDTVRDLVQRLRDPWLAHGRQLQGVLQRAGGLA